MTRNAAPLPLLLLALCLVSFSAGCTDTGDQGSQDIDGATDPPEKDIAGEPLDIIEDAESDPDILEDAESDPDIIEDAPDGPGNCEPQCEGKECGDDGCGNECGTCPEGTPICSDNLCGSANDNCPTAVIVVAEGEEVLPQTTLHLDGTQSYGVEGQIAVYEWSVFQPEGSIAVLVPNASHPNPTLVANVAGTYTFKLTVWDENGLESCFSAYGVVEVLPGPGIHIELTWDTPGDENQGDQGAGAGADMDLHFAHWFAGGEDLDGDGEADGWFHYIFDCYWLNAYPSWGSADPAIQDDPSLDLDDFDGAGPENLNLLTPQDGPTLDDRYKVGVHYWADNGFGPSHPAIRLYISGELAYTAQGPPMNTSDMWFVAEISWPDGEVIPTNNDDGSPKVVSDYGSSFGLE